MRVTPGLYAPESYRRAAQELVEDIANGCGAAGSIDFVPDHILFLDTSEACNIHDWEFHWGVTVEDMHSANRAFKNNLVRIINIKGGILRRPRLLLASAAYWAVEAFGGPAFWANKEGGPIDKPIQIRGEK